MSCFLPHSFRYCLSSGRLNNQYCRCTNYVQYLSYTESRFLNSKPESCKKPAKGRRKGKFVMDVAVWISPRLVRSAGPPSILPFILSITSNFKQCGSTLLFLFLSEAQIPRFQVSYNKINGTHRVYTNVAGVTRRKLKKEVCITSF